MSKEIAQLKPRASRKVNRSVSFEPELYQRVKIEAERQQRSINWMVNNYVRQELSRLGVTK